jgi:hypothetical protein
MITDKQKTMEKEKREVRNKIKTNQTIKRKKERRKKEM